jgi:hypothetical protein
MELEEIGEIIWMRKLARRHDEDQGSCRRHSDWNFFGNLLLLGAYFARNACRNCGTAQNAGRLVFGLNYVVRDVCRHRGFNSSRWSCLPDGLQTRFQPKSMKFKTVYFQNSLDSNPQTGDPISTRISYLTTK